MKIHSPLNDLCPEQKITNHSARRQVVKKLKSGGVPKCEIKNITGHASEKGLYDYDSGDENEQGILSNVISGHSAASVPNRPVLNLAQQQVCLATSNQSHTLYPAITDFSEGYSDPLPQTVPVIPSVPMKNHTIIRPVVQQGSSLANREILKDIITANNTTPASSHISQMPSRLPTYNFHKCNVTINVSSKVEKKQETKSKARKRVKVIESDSEDDLDENIFFPADDDFGSLFQELQY